MPFREKSGFLQKKRTLANSRNGNLQGIVMQHIWPVQKGYKLLPCAAAAKVSVQLLPAMTHGNNSVKPPRGPDHSSARVVRTQSSGSTA